VKVINISWKITPFVAKLQAHKCILTHFIALLYFSVIWYKEAASTQCTTCLSFSTLKTVLKHLPVSLQKASDKRREQLFVITYMFLHMATGACKMSFSFKIISWKLTQLFCGQQVELCCTKFSAFQIFL